MPEEGFLMTKSAAVARPIRIAVPGRPPTPVGHAAVAAGSRRISRATYVRRRALVAALAVVLVLVMAQAGAALGGSSLAAPERRPASTHAEAKAVVVHDGDSLWSIARRLAPGSDPRPIVDALSAARGGAPLVPGETIEWQG
jgi:hypothetical protein